MYTIDDILADFAVFLHNKEYTDISLDRHKLLRMRYDLSALEALCVQRSNRYGDYIRAMNVGLSRYSIVGADERNIDIGHLIPLIQKGITVGDVFEFVDTCKPDDPNSGLAHYRQLVGINVAHETIIRAHRHGYEVFERFRVFMMMTYLTLPRIGLTPEVVVQIIAANDTEHDDHIYQLIKRIQMSNGEAAEELDVLVHAYA